MLSEESAMLNGSWRVAVLASVGASLVCMGCETKSAAVAPSAPSAIVVSAKDGTQYFGSAMQIQVAEGAAFASGTIDARAVDERVWIANVALSLDRLNADTISLQRKPLAPGVGVMTIGSGGETVESGTLSFALESNRKVEGQTATVPDMGSATFVGRFSVSCWVYPATLGQANNGDPESGRGPGGTRIEDVDFTSSFCRRFAGMK